MDFLEAAPALVHCSELGESVLRGTYILLALVRKQSVPHCLSIV